MGEEALLALVRVVAEKHEALAAASGQGFNLFEILKRETDEVHTHSAILAELLDPQGSHGQGPVFARAVCEAVRHSHGRDRIRAGNARTDDQQGEPDRHRDDDRRPVYRH